MAYNLETVLAEKMGTVLDRGVANTRLRDFYDIFVLQKEYTEILDMENLQKAFTETCRKRGTLERIPGGREALEKIRQDIGMETLWRSYQRKYQYAKDIAWDQVMGSVRDLYRSAAEAKEVDKKGREPRDHVSKEREI